ncbi:MAG: hypothetical protein SFT93_05365 [Rickettsiaceae bacterium]|nr:hypothetical protein [Rickettsiaceae bacterium]
MNVKIENALSAQARAGLASASKDLRTSAIMFARNSKFASASENIFANLESFKNIQSMKSNESIVSSLSRVGAALTTRIGILEQMKNELDILIDLSNRAASTMPSSFRESCKSTFNISLERFKNIPKTAEYGGIKLLDGSFGTGKKIEITGPTRNSKVSTTGALTTITDNFEHSRGRIDINSNAIHGDTITIGPSTDPIIFTFVSNNPDISKNQILIGTNREDTALNTAIALSNSDHISPKRFEFTWRGDHRVDFTNLSMNSAQLTSFDISSSSQTSGRVQMSFVSRPTGGVDTERAIKEGITGQLGNISLVNSEAGTAKRAIWVQYLNALDIGGTASAAHATDVLSKFSFTIGTERYNGYLFNQNAGTSNGRDNRLYCIKESNDVSGKIVKGNVFAFNLQAFQDFRTNPGVNISNFITNFNQDAAKIFFKQACFIALDTREGEISVSGTSIGSVHGMKAILTSSDFNDLRLHNVVCTDNYFSVILTDKDGYKKDFTAALPTSYNIRRCSRFRLTHYLSGDTLDLFFDKDIDLGSDIKRGRFASAIKQTLRTAEDNNFILDPDITSVLEIKLNDMTWENIASGNNEINIDTISSAQNAGLFLIGLKEKINKEISLTSAYDITANGIKEQMRNLSLGLSEATQETLSIDLSSTRAKIENAIFTTEACIAVIIASSKSLNVLQKLLD